MKFFDGCKVKLVLFGFVAAVVVGSGSANAEFIFGTPTNLGPTVNSSALDSVPSISADGLELYFSSGRPGGYGSLDIWVTKRPTKDDPWGTPVNLGSTVNSSYDDPTPSISADGLTLYFSSNRAGEGGYDLWLTTRATVSDPWGTPVNLGSTVNSSYDETSQSISADGLSIYFSSYDRHRPDGYGGRDIWVTTRPTTNDPWGQPVNLGPTVNSSHHDWRPSISADGLSLFFPSNRPGGYGSWDLYVTMRKTKEDPWSPPVNLGPTVNTASAEMAPSISHDGRDLYFSDFGGPRPGGVGDADL